MNILIHTVPYMKNATYFIDIGYANAFTTLGHSVCLLTYGDPLPDPIQFRPDISISYFHVAYSQQTDYERLAQYKKMYDTRIVVWGSPFGVPAARYTDEHDGLHPKRHQGLMAKNIFDLCLSFYPREGVDMYYRRWTKDFGIPVLSLPLAADTTVFKPCKPDKEFDAELCFIGGIHRTKEKPFYDYLLPLLDRYELIAAGRGWEGWPVRQVSIPYGQESKVISSTCLVPNVHMELSRKVPGMPPNMRTFQSIAGGGLVVSDHVAALRSYFSEDEIPMGDTPEDYVEKIDYFMDHPEQRFEYWTRAYGRVTREHTYVHRAGKLLEALWMGG
jgi:hypothetical protein